MAASDTLELQPIEDKGLLGNITRRQLELLRYIRRYIEINGTSPSYQEMVEATGCKSKSNIARLVGGLVERNYIERQAHRSRGIDLTAKGLAKTHNSGE